MHYFIKPRKKYLKTNAIDNNKYQIPEWCYLNIDALMCKRITSKFFRFFESGSNILSGIQNGKNIMVSMFKLRNRNYALL